MKHQRTHYCSVASFEVGTLNYQLRKRIFDHVTSGSHGQKLFSFLKNLQFPSKKLVTLPIGGMRSAVSSNPCSKRSLGTLERFLTLSTGKRGNRPSVSTILSGIVSLFFPQKQNSFFSMLGQTEETSQARISSFLQANGARTLLR